MSNSLCAVLLAEPVRTWIHILTKDFYYDFSEAKFFSSCVQTLNDDPSTHDSCVADDFDYVPGYNCGSLCGIPAYQARHVVAHGGDYQTSA